MRSWVFFHINITHHYYTSILHSSIIHHSSTKLYYISIYYYTITSPPALPRIAKRKMDDYVFFGNPLHVCYAPEFETLDDLEAKLLRRKQDVHTRLRVNGTRPTAAREQPALRYAKHMLN